MTKVEALQQMASLLEHCKDMARGEYSEEWDKDVEAIKLIVNDVTTYYDAFRKICDDMSLDTPCIEGCRYKKHCKNETVASCSDAIADYYLRIVEDDT